MVSIMNAVIAYHTYSGNTQEIAELIEFELIKYIKNVSMHRIGIDSPVRLHEDDILFLGTFTWDYGKVPDEVKDFIAELGYKPHRVAVFGSGDTQFGGEELFCKAVDKLSNFYNSRAGSLKIEQSPRGMQEKNIINWTKEVLNLWRS